MTNETITLNKPYPMFTWTQTPLYKQDHASANQNDIFYCGRDIKPPTQWWETNHAKLKLGYVYWVIESQRKGNKCAICKDAWANHLRRKRDPHQGYWQNPEPQGTVVSLDALKRLSRDGLL